MAAPANSNLMGAAILRRAGQQARQGPVNYSGTGTGPQVQQQQKPLGTGIPGRAPTANVTRAPQPGMPGPAAPAAQRTSIPFYAGAQQRAGYAQGAPIQRTTAAAPPQQAGTQVQARPTQIPVRSPVSGVTVQRAGMPQVLGPTAPTQAQDPGAGRERADQSLMGPVTQTPVDVAAQRARDAFGNVGGPYGGAHTEIKNAGYGANAGNPADAANAMLGNVASGENPYSGLIANVGKALFDPAAELSGAMSESVNKQADEFRDQYLGNYDAASGEIMDAGRGLLDPNAQAAAEAAARDSLYAGIGRERDTAVAQMLDRGNRGGRTGSGSTQAAYQAAIAAAQEGERGLTQDAFGRRLQATGAGANLLGQGAGMDYQAIRDLYADPQKMMELIMAMGPDFVDAIVPL